MNISQPAIAQAIDKLEVLTGLKLFDRYHARGTEVTRQGREFLKQARRLTACALEVQHEAAAIAAELSGTIRLGCFHTIAPFHLAPLVMGYRSLYPKVGIEACEMRQDELIAKLASGSIDLAIVYDMALDPSFLQWRVLAEARPYVILAPGHPLARRSSVSLRELQFEPFILFDGSGSRDYFRALLGRHGIDPPVAFTSESFESVRSAVGNALGFSLLAMRPCHEETYDGNRVASVEIAEDVEPIRIVLARKQGAEPGQLVTNFIDYCTSNFPRAG